MRLTKHITPSGESPDVDPLDMWRHPSLWRFEFDRGRTQLSGEAWLLTCRKTRNASTPPQSAPPVEAAATIRPPSPAPT